MHPTTRTKTASTHLVLNYKTRRTTRQARDSLMVIAPQEAEDSRATPHASSPVSTISRMIDVIGDKVSVDVCCFFFFKYTVGARALSRRSIPCRRVLKSGMSPIMQKIFVSISHNFINSHFKLIHCTHKLYPKSFHCTLNINTFHRHSQKPYVIRNVT